MAAAAKPSKKELKRQIQSKTSFTSPFSTKWSPLSQNDQDFILTTLKDKLIAIGLEKKEVKAPRQWRKKKENKPDAEDVREPDCATNGWTDAVARRQLAVGINEATKALERNQLQLLLVCKSVRPQRMTNHLIALSSTRGVPACQVPRLSKSLAENMGLKSVLALGFRMCSSEEKEMFRDTVDAIKPRVPALNVEWLRGEAAGATSELTADLAEEKEVEVKEGEGERRAQKRKLEIESDITASPLSCSLQPLKVKRIVPNPAKKRKTTLKKPSTK